MKQPSAKDRILKINWIDKGKPISKSGVEWIYDESIKELQKQHVQELKDQKAKILSSVKSRYKLGFTDGEDAMDYLEDLIRIIERV